MTRNLTCIICPRGCSLIAEINGDEVRVSGQACPKGEKYAIDECTNPVRTVTSIIRVSNLEDTMVSCKTEQPIPKNEIFKVMGIIRKTSAKAPVAIGDVLCDNVCGTRVIATKEIK